MRRIAVGEIIISPFISFFKFFRRSTVVALFLGAIIGYFLPALVLRLAPYDSLFFGGVLVCMYVLEMYSYTKVVRLSLAQGRWWVGLLMFSDCILVGALVRTVLADYFQW
jgi:hypothetical protein